MVSPDSCTNKGRRGEGIKGNFTRFRHFPPSSSYGKTEMDSSNIDRQIGLHLTDPIAIICWRPKRWRSLCFFGRKENWKDPESQKILEAKQLENCENNGKLGREDSGKNNLTPPRAASQQKTVDKFSQFRGCLIACFLFALWVTHHRGRCCVGKFAMRANSGIASHTLFFVQQRKKILSSIAFDVKAVFFFSVYFFLGISSERLWRGMKKMPCGVSLSRHRLLLLESFWSLWRRRRRRLWRRAGKQRKGRRRNYSFLKEMRSFERQVLLSQLTRNV